MDIETHRVLIKRREEAEAELQKINEESYDLKIRKAKAERTISQVKIALGEVEQVTEKDVTGH